MPQTTKISTNDTKHSSRKTDVNLVDEPGIDEPYWNPDPTTMMVRFEGKYYKFDADGKLYRFYPPGLKRSRSKPKPTP